MADIEVDVVETDDAASEHLRHRIESQKRVTHHCGSLSASRRSPRRSRTAPCRRLRKGVLQRALEGEAVAGLEHIDRRRIDREFDLARPDEAELVAGMGIGSAVPPSGSTVTRSRSAPHPAARAAPCDALRTGRGLTCRRGRERNRDRLPCRAVGNEAEARRRAPPRAATCTRTRSEDMPRSIWLSAPTEMPALGRNFGQRQLRSSRSARDAPTDVEIRLGWISVRAFSLFARNHRSSSNPAVSSFALHRTPRRSTAPSRRAVRDACSQPRRP